MVVRNQGLTHEISPDFVGKYVYYSGTVFVAKCCLMLYEMENQFRELLKERGGISNALSECRRLIKSSKNSYLQSVLRNEQQKLLHELHGSSRPPPRPAASRKPGKPPKPRRKRGKVKSCSPPPRRRPPRRRKRSPSPRSTSSLPRKAFQRKRSREQTPRAKGKAHRSDMTASSRSETSRSSKRRASQPAQPRGSSKERRTKRRTQSYNSQLDFSDLKHSYPDYETNMRRFREMDDGPRKRIPPEWTKLDVREWGISVNLKPFQARLLANTTQSGRGLLKLKLRHENLKQLGFTEVAARNIIMRECKKLKKQEKERRRQQKPLQAPRTVAPDPPPPLEPERIADPLSPLPGAQAPHAAPPALPNSEADGGLGGQDQSTPSTNRETSVDSTGSREALKEDFADLHAEVIEMGQPIELLEEEVSPRTEERSPNIEQRSPGSPASPPEHEMIGGDDRRGEMEQGPDKSPEIETVVALDEREEEEEDNADAAWSREFDQGSDPPQNFPTDGDSPVEL